MWPHRRQPTRLPRPWDSPDKNTGVGCHFLLHVWKWKLKVTSLSCVRLLVTPWTACSPPGSSIHGIFQARVLEWGAIAFSWHDVSCHNSKNWPQRNRTKLRLELKTVLETMKMRLIRPPHDNFKMTIRVDGAVSACNPLPLLIKKRKKKKNNSFPLTVSFRDWPWMRVCPARRESDLPIWPSYSEVANLWNKANFPFHQLCLFIGFRSVSNQIPLLVI